MVTRNKNFEGQATPSIVDDEYVNCRFFHAQPVLVDGKMRGVQLFPGDDTPRVFTDCLMCNAEPPPRSTVTGGLHIIKEFDIDDDAGGKKNILHGKWDSAADDYDYLPAPVETAVIVRAPSVPGRED